MRKLVSIAVASTAVVAMACGRSKAPASTAMSADLQRDLKLASAVPTMQINPDEVAPQAKKELALRPKKAPDGPKVVRTSHPTVKASPKPVEVADIQSAIPQVEVTASAPAPSPTQDADDAPPLARPAPVPVQSYPSAGQIPDQGNGGIGAVIGSIFRGAILGGDDDCDPRHEPRRPTDIYRRPGRPIGSMGGGIMGGMAGGRVPIVPMGRPR